MNRSPVVFIGFPKAGEKSQPLAVWPPVKCEGCKAMHALGYRHIVSGEFRCVDCHEESKP